MENQNIKNRLEEIRIEIRAERISLGEICELQSLGTIPSYDSNSSRRLLANPMA